MKINSPFTDDLVNSLNEWQTNGVMHPYTCAYRDKHPDDEGILIATNNGWYCPVPTCTYTQDWCMPSIMTRSRHV